MEQSSKVDEDMAADSKVDPPRGETPSSLESSPEPDAGAEPSQEPAQPQKRKGGRKPIYATSEERKQRNRQAQAAFRERRTEYIKQLEATIKHNEEQLSTLQQSQRTAADECLMLRYKNSLLERILLEKGVDVQAELAIKTGSLNFQHPAANLPAPQPPLQRTAISRHHARRSGNFLPKLAPTGANSDAKMQLSPQGHPTPSSHASSPTNISTKSPMVMQTTSNTPPSSAGLTPSQQQFHNFSRAPQQPGQPFFPNQQISPPAQRPGPPPHYRSNTSVQSNQSAGSRQSLARQLSGGIANAHTDPSAQHLYSDPFQKHIDRLEREYDAQQSGSMLDQGEGDDMSDPSPDRLQGQYPPQYDQQQSRPGEYYIGVSQGTQPLPPNQGMPPTSHPPGTDSSFPTMDDIIDPNDPMLDADPFGLSASMHYPTAYAFEQPPQR